MPPHPQPSPPTSNGHHAFPSVVIDLSEPSAKVVVTSDGNSVQDTSLSRPVNGTVPHLQSSSSASASKPANIATSSSLPLPPAEMKTPTHRPTKSIGPSALEQVVSKTRPAYLPPKPKPEDRKHQSDWEAMMKQSRAAGKATLVHLHIFTTNEACR